MIVLCLVLGAGGAYGYSKRKTKKYSATASVVFNYSPLTQQVAGLSAGGTSSSQLLAQLSNDVELAKGGDTAAKTARLVGHGATPAGIASSVSIAGQGESGVIDISATSISPVLAAAIANTYAHQFVGEQQRATRQYFKSALALVRRQLAALPPRQRVGPDGLQLQNRAQTLSLLTELTYNNVQVGQQALPPASPSSPRTSRDTGLGALLGLVLGLAFAFMLERLDRRIRRPEELERIYRLPMLGAVPKSAALAGKGGRSALPPTEAEAFGLIRAHLRFFNVNRRLRTIAVVSAAAGEGRSTIARYLAEAEARAGSRVLLLEADLRHPTLARQLGFEPGPGLADVLIGSVRVDEAIRPVELEAPGNGVAGRTLQVLTAGAMLPLNPGELLESRAMTTLLEQTKSTYDLVILDTPPSTVVSDALLLLTRIDGAVVVGWAGRSRRDVAERLYRVLAGSGSSLLGVIANGARASGRGGYTYTAAGGGPMPPPSSMNGASAPEQLVTTGG